MRPNSGTWLGQVWVRVRVRVRVTLTLTLASNPISNPNPNPGTWQSSEETLWSKKKSTWLGLGLG